MSGGYCMGYWWDEPELSEPHYLEALMDKEFEEEELNRFRLNRLLFLFKPFLIIDFNCCDPLCGNFIDEHCF